MVTAPALALDDWALAAVAEVVLAVVVEVAVLRGVAAAAGVVAAAADLVAGEDESDLVPAREA